MNVEDYDFHLPEELIAQTPLLDRSASRLLMVNKENGQIQHRHFTDILEQFQAGDTLVLNDTRVIPARLFGVKADTGAQAELLLLKELGDDRWETLARPAKRLKKGTVIRFGGSGPQDSASDTLLEAVVEEEGEM